MSIFGVYGVNNAANIVYYGLHALQHRGQEAAGIASFDENGVGIRHRGEGLLSEVFNPAIIDSLKGHIAMGAVKYANASKKGLDNVPPFYFHHSSGDFAIANDGSLVNHDEVAAYLESLGSIFVTDTDSELMANLIKKEALDDRIFNIVSALEKMDGGFTFLIMTKKRLYACRDKNGIKPLAIGRLGDGYVVSSESCAFELVGATFLRDVEPGEIVTIDHHGLRCRHYDLCSRNRVCGMEFIYFARPDSDIDGCNVHAYRKESGRMLYREAPADADIVVGVPDSSLSAAMGYSEESHIPYEMGLIKSKYVGRTFIEPSQELRDNGVKMKLSAVRSIVNGRRVVLVDDSIVRGTTSLKIIKLLREAGATEVHVRIASPMMTHPCFYGVDTSTTEELLCAHRSVEEAAEVIGADSLGFLSTDSAVAACPGREELCLACFSGKYPTPLYSHEPEIQI